ncbi:MAG: S26 family signal peptidase [Alphaproteobacteria bacterium]|nr:S26 family signal peptidase [Alphaproteobacteria bacterium]
MFYLRRVVGNSMEPTLKEGQLVLLSKARNFKQGDVVIAFIDGREVIKRISKYKNGQMFLEGDNQLGSTDSNNYGWVVDTHVEGKVIFPSTKLK